MGADQLEQPGVHVRPDAAARLGCRDTRGQRRTRAVPTRGRGRRRERAGLVELGVDRGHVVDGDDDLEVELLVAAGVDDGDRAGPVVVVAAEEPRDLVERALRRGEADALRRPVRDRVEALEGERQVRTALGGGECVDLVDDHPAHGPQRLARLRGEHQVERLGCGDEDVGRRADERLAGLALRVAGAECDRGFVERHAQALGGERDPAERRAEVLLDVDREGAQRRDVEDAAAIGLLRHRLGADAVDRPEEGREGLARAGRGEDQGVVTGRDRRPPAVLGRSRRREARVEPGLDGR